ncbi:hypothetical protein C900_01132 [Fulvivirga imtechensis AK7]|uniref:DUF3267 domain-containing protein n=1 Tax=Fulvivirga imtechensis AK7 TaxID=1237149 RepID=L8JX55_9BACT|nr:DUF3267 domain-containing protein [Fulvivirga imtechensis]ELR72753.1 hypothetical protein C900_01132 [Fulvivirga imtechensis AK7]
MEGRQIEQKEYTMTGSSMNLVAFLFLIPMLLLLASPYISLYSYADFREGWKLFFKHLLLILPVGIIIHELLHGVTWACFAKQGMKSISFGMNWKAIAPYCHCSEPLKVKHYRLGGAMPGVVMGIIPVIIATIFQINWMIVFGVFFTWAASGDIIALWMLRRFNANEMVSDHPEKMGFYVHHQG